MIVDDLRCAEAGDGVVERSARLRWKGGEARLWARVPARAAAPADDASPYLAAALQLAMRRGEELEVDGLVSARLLERAGRIQSVYTSWNPGLRRARVRAEAREDGADPGAHTACFFSRGVDSSYSAIAERPGAEALERLVFVDGLDLRHDAAVRAEEVRLAGEAAAAIGLPTDLVATNVRELSEPLCDWEDMAGAGLAFVALSLAGAIGRMVIPATDTYMSLTPCGTSPVLDPLFSTESVEVIHDAPELTRTGKVARIAERAPALLPYLKVCFAENRPDNCGRCPKCLLTMVALQAANALGTAAGFPDRIDPAALDEIRLDATALAPRHECAEACRALRTDGEAGVTRRALLDRLADLGRWVDPAQPYSLETFRTHHARMVISVARDGRPYPPLADAASHARAGWDDSLGLVRAVDPVGARHLYGVGAAPPGRLVGELGALRRHPSAASVAAWLTTDGRLVTDDWRPVADAAAPRLVARWVVAPLAWRGWRTPSARLRTLLWRARRAPALDRATADTPGGEPVGYLYREPGEGRVPLYSAIHPVTGDQLLSSSPRYAADAGYGHASLLGYLDDVAPVTGRRVLEAPILPWASRLGQFESAVVPA